jgi:hypothetical protein
MLMDYIEKVDSLQKNYQKYMVVQMLNIVKNVKNNIIEILEPEKLNKSMIIKLQDFVMIKIVKDNVKYKI